MIGRKFFDKEVQEYINYLPFKVIKDPNSDRLKFQVTYKNKEEEFYVEEIIAMILQNLKKSANNFLGKVVKNAVIAVPNYFTDLQRQCIKDAGTMAGLNVIRIVNESTVAALSFGFEKKIDESKILIFDFGAGNLNISLLALDDDLYEVIAMNGNSHLGGEDLDNKLVQYCINEFTNQSSININIRDNPKAFQRLKSACERAKKDLSYAKQTTINIDCLVGRTNFNIVIKREIFEELCMDLFKKFIQHLEEVLKDARLSKNQIDEVILIGGSSRIPKIQTMIKEFFNGKELNKKLNQDSVAYGAAIQAAIMTNVIDKKIERIILLDVTPFSLGIETNGETMTILIPRNSTIPCKKTQIFSTCEDFQKIFIINIFEGEKQLTKYNNFLGKLVFEDIQLMPKGKSQIEVTFDIDGNSIINVNIIESLTRKEKNMVITNDQNRLNQFYISQKIEEFKNFEEEEKKEYEETKINFEIYFYGIRQMIKDKKLENKFSKEERNRINKKIEEILYWINTNTTSSKEDYIIKIKEIGTIINPFIKKIYQENIALLRKEEDK